MSKRMVRGLKIMIKHLLQTKICFGVTTNTHQSISSYCKDRNAELKNRPLVTVNEY